MAIRQESKLSPKSMGWAPEDIKIALRDVKQGDGVALFRVMGVANGTKMALDRNNNPTEGLTGQFKGTSTKGGDDVESGVLYLPGGLHYQIAGALKANQATDRSAQSKFVVDVFARHSSNQIGYEYYAATPVAPARADVFSELAEAAGEMPALPAPKAAEPAADAKGGKPAKEATGAEAS